MIINIFRLSEIIFKGWIIVQEKDITIMVVEADMWTCEVANSRKSDENGMVVQRDKPMEGYDMVPKDIITGGHSIGQRNMLERTMR